MPALLIRHRVSDYRQWKRLFDDQELTRRANGCLGATLYRNAADPSEILVLLVWDNVVRARLYSQSDDLHESLDQASAIDDPELLILQEIEDVAPTSLR